MSYGDNSKVENSCIIHVLICLTLWKSAAWLINSVSMSYKSCLLVRVPQKFKVCSRLPCLGSNKRYGTVKPCHAAPQLIYARSARYALSFEQSKMRSIGDKISK